MRCRGVALGVGLVGLAVITGCVGTENIQYNWSAARFNEQIRADFKPLTPADAMADPKYGFFRDGSGGGLVNEVFPVSAAAPDAGPGSLVQTPCLFAGAELDVRGQLVANDDLRLVWELVAFFATPSGSSISENFRGPESRDLGLCSLSTPGRRLLFENPEATLVEARNLNAYCRPESNVDTLDFAWTVSEDPEDNFNQELQCVVGHWYHEIALRAVSPSQVDPDGACPIAPGPPVSPARPAHFDGISKDLTPAIGATGWFLNDYWSVCGFSPNHVVPTGDASYRLSLKDGHSFGDSAPERWLSPNVMMVPGRRKIVRPMTPPAAGSLQRQWHTAVEQLGGGEGPLRWAENFTPTVQVEGVEILSRGSAGAEQIEPPTDRKLTILVPRPGGTTASVTCTLAPGQSRFAIPADCAIEDVRLSVLTPTYATAFLHDTPPVTTPITWTAALRNLLGRTAFIRFHLRARGEAARMRISPIRDFGGLQLGRWREGELVLENIGGQPLEVRGIGFAPGSPHPGDFSFVVVGDPVQVPLPIEAKPDGAGGSLLRQTADAADAPILTLTEVANGVQVALGDPIRGSATQPLTLYGQGARLVGGLLIRDDPAAAFTPSLPSYPRPFTVTAFAERSAPFVLRPGEAAKIAVIAEPTGLGVRTAALRVDAVSVGPPGNSLWAIGQLRVDSLQGPQIASAPGSLWFNKAPGHTAAEARRAAMIHNVGSFDLDVTQIQIQGPHAARFSVLSERGLPPLRLPPVDYADFWITYTPECDGSYGTASSLVDHQATLVIGSTGGHVELPLSGSSYGFCELP